MGPDGSPQRGEAQDPRCDDGPETEREGDPLLSLVKREQRKRGQHHDGGADDPRIPRGVGLARVSEILGRQQKAEARNDIGDIERRPVIRRK